MNTKQEQIKKLTEGHNKHLIKWLSLENWETLPTEEQMDEISEAWYALAAGGSSFTRYARHRMNEDTVTAKEIYEDLIQDPKERHKYVSFTHPYFETEYIQSLEDRYDVYGPVVYEAVRMVRRNFRKNF